MHTKCANIMTKLRSIQIDGNSSVELRDLAKEKWHKFVRAHSTVAAAADALSSKPTKEWCNTSDFSLSLSWSCNVTKCREKPGKKSELCIRMHVSLLSSLNFSQYLTHILHEVLAAFGFTFVFWREKKATTAATLADSWQIWCSVVCRFLYVHNLVYLYILFIAIWFPGYLLELMCAYL